MTIEQPGSPKAPKKPEPGTSLIALNSQYQGIAAQLTAIGGELTPDTEKALDEIIAKLCEKADAYGIVKEQLESGAAFWKFQKEKCAGAQRVFENAVESLKSRMRFVLEQLPGEKLQGDLYRFFLCKGANSITIDETLLPKKYMKTKIDFVVDREQIEAALAKGETIPGVTVKTDNKSMRQGRPNP